MGRTLIAGQNDLAYCTEHEIIECSCVSRCVLCGLKSSFSSSLSSVLLLGLGPIAQRAPVFVGNTSSPSLHPGEWLSGVDTHGGKASKQNPVVAAHFFRNVALCRFPTFDHFPVLFNRPMAADIAGRAKSMHDLTHVNCVSRRVAVKTGETL